VNDPLVVLLVLESHYLLLIEVILVLVLKLILYEVGCVAMALAPNLTGLLTILFGCLLVLGVLLANR
jgi:hypothetical protein